VNFFKRLADHFEKKKEKSNQKDYYTWLDVKFYSKKT